MAAVRHYPRGTSLLTGTIVEWSGGLGWIEPTTVVQHPDASKNRGKIKLMSKDCNGGSAWVQKGLKVAFMLYGDQWGLGAEKCRSAVAGKASGGGKGQTAGKAISPAAGKGSAAPPPGKPIVKAARVATPAADASAAPLFRHIAAKATAKPPGAVQATIQKPASGKQAQGKGAATGKGPVPPAGKGQTILAAGKGRGADAPAAKTGNQVAKATGKGSVISAMVKPGEAKAGKNATNSSGKGAGTSGPASAPKAVQPGLKGKAGVAAGKGSVAAAKGSVAAAKGSVAAGKGSSTMGKGSAAAGVQKTIEKKLPLAAAAGGKAAGKDSRIPAASGIPKKPDTKKKDRTYVGNVKTTGTVTDFIKNTYGWIMPDKPLVGKHPEGNKRGGKVYVHTDDVVKGSELKKGAKVQFYLYSDTTGFGAEDCEVVTRTGAAATAAAAHTASANQQSGKAAGKSKAASGASKIAQAAGKNGAKPLIQAAAGRIWSGAKPLIQASAAKGPAAKAAPVARSHSVQKTIMKATPAAAAGPKGSWVPKGGGKGGPAKGLATGNAIKAASSGAASARNGKNPPLPANWEEHWSDEHEVPYYWNKKTRESLWIRPTA
eukprot:TRINITY_DN75802_c0_g1_i1.p1 TRINITY_DN75802_c0_g1~~TRINITY_DN75802_c0_g1_i1.p1  ORF type:complete len:601 (+),score=159.57 TRINITY_DN75802_c0_g1_i1:124-1926(+)